MLVAGEIRNKAISASNKVEVEVEAELGNMVFLTKREAHLGQQHKQKLSPKLEKLHDFLPSGPSPSS